jgi:hypothetical protein
MLIPRYFRRLILTLVLGALGFLGGCVDKPALSPIPRELVDAALVPEFGAIRQWGDAPGIISRTAWYAPTRAAPPTGGPGEPLNVLALSGGAANGSFAAGLLTGWTEAGTRPQFHVVTGVSVGALEAPFAFLGPAYDPILRDLFTRLSSPDLFKQKPGLAAYFSDSLASARPLASLIEEFIDESLLRAIAAEHRKGRRLFVGTTHVYASRPMIWDVGAIAASGRAEALDLIRRVLLASAAVPVLLPPVYFDVVAGNGHYQEMHVDGGITREAFIGPPGLDWDAAARVLGTGHHVEFYVIRNGRARGEYMIMEPRTVPLGQHAMLQLTQSVGVGDLYRIYVRAQREQAGYHAAWIGSDFDAPWEDWDDPRYMHALFDYGYAQAVGGQVWHSEPPGVSPALQR